MPADWFLALALLFFAGSAVFFIAWCHVNLADRMVASLRRSWWR